MPAFSFSAPVNELNSWSFTCDLTKDDGTALGPSAVESLTMTLYDVSTNTIINGVDHEDILNVGRGALNAAGHLVVTLESADNPIVGSGTKEKHRVLIIATWNSGKGYTSQEIIFTVVNVNRVP
jgi:hypothetical protein